jgi:glycosyltransferase involved in cell wall biosynthesis
MASDLELLDQPNQSAGAPVTAIGLNNTSASPRTDTLRVLHVINGEHYAGAERVQDWLAMRLPELGVEVGFACLKPDRFPAMRRSQNTRLISVPMSSRFDIRSAWRLARIARTENFDIIHTHTPRSSLVGHLASRLANVPHVHHVHGHTASEVGHGLLKKVAAQIERLSLSRAAAIIAVSPSAAEYIHRWGVPKERIHLVPNGVPSRKCLMNRRNTQGIWTLGLIALLRPRKGLEDLLRALAILQQQKEPVKLRVIGRFECPKYEEEMKNLATDLGIVDLVAWRGFRQDIEAELDQLDVVVLPSILPEGMPMAVLEAMASGVPTIGTKVDGISDVIQNGQNGLLVRPGEPSELADAVSEIIRGKHDWQVLRRNSIAVHAERFSDEAMAAGVAQVYQKVLQP